MDDRPVELDDVRVDQRHRHQARRFGPDVVHGDPSGAGPAHGDYGGQ
jgi:hypothetical protein